MEMPNTNPPVFTQELLEDKYQIAASNALANYSFFMGTSQDNVEEILKTNAKKNEVCGVKIFMGSSTGNLLVDNPIVLERIFEGSELLIATHCEEEAIIKKNKANLEATKAILEPSDHPIIRDVDACFESSFKAIQLAKKFDTRLHILHISTAKELQLFSNLKPLAEKRITAEVCVHHLWFNNNDYASKGNFIKWNPAIKTENDRTKLWEALLNDKIDVIATDHAPHTLE
jgi:dihydroorotase